MEEGKRLTIKIDSKSDFFASFGKHSVQGMLVYYKNNWFRSSFERDTGFNPSFREAED
jgi:hypothetical protein